MNGKFKELDKELGKLYLQEKEKLINSIKETIKRKDPRGLIFSLS